LAIAFVVCYHNTSVKQIGLNSMQTRLKSWESPRRQGRNDKGKGGAARRRQLKKRQQMLRQKLKQNGEDRDLPSFFV
jgi:hypothetical protein